MQPSTERSYVTISVDDGHPTDLKTADLLAGFGLRATFYIPATNPERPVLPASEIKGLSQAFEIGGHTLNHRRLTSLSSQEARREVVDGKQWLEALTGLPAVAFCYPQGKFNAKLASLVREAGFRGARTCLFNLHAWPVDPFAWGVTTHAYSHSGAIQLRHALREGNFQGLRNFFSIHGAATDWEEHFLRGLDHVEACGGIAHLYLHSWEIDGRNEWQTLRRALAAIATHRTLIPVTNGELFELWQGRHANGQ